MALLNQSNISSNLTKLLFWTKCWIGLTECKNNTKKEKNMLDEEKSCWTKIWLGAIFSFNIFRLIQHNFHAGQVYSLFHPTFHSCDTILNVRTSSFEWFNKTKTLCKLIAIKKSHTSNQNKLEQQRRRFWPSALTTRTKWGKIQRCSRRSWR